MELLAFGGNSSRLSLPAAGVRGRLLGSSFHSFDTCTPCGGALEAKVDGMRLSASMGSLSLDLSGLDPGGKTNGRPTMSNRM